MSERKAGKLLVAAVIAGVAMVLVWALWVVGSPAKERLRRMDRQKVASLRDLCRAVEAFRDQHDTLPKNLEELTAWEELDTPRADPESGKPYSYEATGETAFRLCATFELESGSGERSPFGIGDRFDRWRHPAGAKCFDLRASADR